jgi:hypothetical protein
MVDKRKSLRLKTAIKEDEKRDESGSAASSSVRNAKFTLSEFEAAWEAFADAHPDKKILVNSMRRGVPKHVSNLMFRIAVDNQAQQEEFESNIGLVLDFLRERLQNDNITLTTELTVEEQVARRLTRDELLQRIQEKYPEVMEMLSDLDAEVV